MGTRGPQGKALLGAPSRAAGALLAVAGLALAGAAPALAHAPYDAQAWGQDSSGQLGNVSRNDSNVPVSVKGLGNVIAMAGGERHSLALIEGGTVRAWGNDTTGALGNGTETSTLQGVPVCAVGATAPCIEESQQLKEAAAVSAGEDFSVALLKDGTVVTWGNDNHGQLGDGAAEGSSSTVPVRVCAVGTSGVCPSGPYLEDVTAIAAGEDHVVALLSSGEVVDWGWNGEGGLGDGTKGAPEHNSVVPVRVCAAGPEVACPSGPYLEGVTAVAAGGGRGEHSLARLSSGKVMAWGYNAYGQLGDGTTTSRDVPVEVKGLSGVSAIAAGRLHSLALLSGGTVEAWGDDESGQLGNGATTSSDTPVAVKGLSGVAAIAAGGMAEHSVALLSSGSVMAWGSNSNGQLGDASAVETISDVPVEVSGLHGAKGVAVGFHHSVAFGRLPAVTALSPRSSPVTGGVSVSITGLDFEEVSEVRFGATRATSFKVNSETSITAVAPAGSGTVNVTVTTPSGTSPAGGSSTFFYGRAELGRCVRAVRGEGSYRNAKCTRVAAPSSGRDNWLPGPGEGADRFSINFKAVALEGTSRKALIECAAGRGEGQYTGPTTLEVLTLVFTGCGEVPLKGLSSDCQNSGSQNGEIRLPELAGELGFLGHKGKKATVGVDLNPASGTVLASFECGGASESTGKGTGSGSARELEGSIIGKLAKVDRMTQTNALAYAASAGHQVPEHFEGAAPDVLTLLVGSGKTAEPATLAGTGEISEQEALEVNTVI